VKQLQISLGGQGFMRQHFRIMTLARLDQRFLERDRVSSISTGVSKNSTSLTE